MGGLFLTTGTLTVDSCLIKADCTLARALAFASSLSYSPGCSRLTTIPGRISRWRGASSSFLRIWSDMSISPERGGVGGGGGEREIVTGWGVCIVAHICVSVSAMHEQSYVVPTSYVIVYIRQDANTRYTIPCIHLPTVSYLYTHQ